MTTIALNLQAVYDRIEHAKKISARQGEIVTLLAVSKTWPASAVVEAVAAGQHAFGENYVQEGVDKILALRELLPQVVLEWHFIGPLQSNKTRAVAEHFDWVHSIDRLRIAERLSAQRPADLGPLKVCIQVNIGDEASKSGVPLAEAPVLARAVAALPNLSLQGLMCIPEADADDALLRTRFDALVALRDQLTRDGLGLPVLSMGMSHDLDAAIAAGSTMVRVGTAIFGQRSHPAP